MSDTTEQHNKEIANEELRKNGYESESLHKLQQWGIFDATNDEQVMSIIRDLLDYRKTDNN